MDKFHKKEFFSQKHQNTFLLYRSSIQRLSCCLKYKVYILRRLTKIFLCSLEDFLFSKTSEIRWLKEEKIKQLKTTTKIYWLRMQFPSLKVYEWLWHFIESTWLEASGERRNKFLINGKWLNVIVKNIQDKINVHWIESGCNGNRSAESITFRPSWERNLKV